MLPRRLLVLALAMLAAGCGGDGVERLSQEDFSRQATEICRGAGAELEELDFDGDTSTAVADYAGAAAPILRERLEELEALHPPEEAEEAYDAFLDEARREVRAIEQLEEAARAEDHAGAGQAARAGRQATIRTAALALRLDIRECVTRRI